MDMTGALGGLVTAGSASEHLDALSMTLQMSSQQA
jgi:hypothetical protein